MDQAGLTLAGNSLASTSQSAAITGITSVLCFFFFSLDTLLLFQLHIPTIHKYVDIKELMN